MTQGNMINNVHSKIVLDYSFCNSSDIWNYLGVFTIILFVIILFRYLKHRQHQKSLRHHKNNYDCYYLFVLILLALFFVVPCMCWLLTLVEILVTLVRYGDIPASPIPILSLPVRVLAYIYVKIIFAIHTYLSAPGTFVFLLFFITLMCLKLVLVLTLRFGLIGFILCAWIGIAMPLYALSEVRSIDSWTDLLFCSQLPLFIIYKFRPLLLGFKFIVLSIFLFVVFLIGCYLKFGLTWLFVCKCLVLLVLVRFTYVMGKGFIVFVFFASAATNSSRSSDDVQ